MRSSSFNDFKRSGVVRATLIGKKSCYAKGFSGILDVFRKPVILASFDK